MELPAGASHSLNENPAAREIRICARNVRHIPRADAQKSSSCSVSRADADTRADPPVVQVRQPLRSDSSGDARADERTDAEGDGHGEYAATDVAGDGASALGATDARADEAGDRERDDDGDDRHRHPE